MLILVYRQIAYKYSNLNRITQGAALKKQYFERNKTNYRD